MYQYLEHFTVFIWVHQLTGDRESTEIERLRNGDLYYLTIFSNYEGLMNQHGGVVSLTYLPFSFVFFFSNRCIIVLPCNVLLKVVSESVILCCGNQWHNECCAGRSAQYLSCWYNLYNLIIFLLDVYWWTPIAVGHRQFLTGMLSEAWFFPLLKTVAVHFCS